MYHFIARRDYWSEIGSLKSQIEYVAVETPVRPEDQKHALVRQLQLAPRLL